MFHRQIDTECVWGGKNKASNSYSFDVPYYRSNPAMMRIYWEIDIAECMWYVGCVWWRWRTERNAMILILVPDWNHSLSIQFIYVYQIIRQWLLITVFHLYKQSEDWPISVLHCTNVVHYTRTPYVHTAHVRVRGIEHIMRDGFAKIHPANRLERGVFRSSPSTSTSTCRARCLIFCLSSNAMSTSQSWR